MMASMEVASDCSKCLPFVYHRILTAKVFAIERVGRDSLRTVHGISDTLRPLILMDVTFTTYCNIVISRYSMLYQLISGTMAMRLYLVVEIIVSRG